MGRFSWQRARPGGSCLCDRHSDGLSLASSWREPLFAAFPVVSLILKLEMQTSDCLHPVPLATPTLFSASEFVVWLRLPLRVRL